MDQGVVITDGQSRVTLVPTYLSADIGCPMRVEVRSTLFSVDIELVARSVAHFRATLVALHKTLTGEARLEFWNEEHSVVFRGYGHGGIEIITRVTDGLVPRRACLTVKMWINRSYLPAIIVEIGEVFAPWLP
jgi:hypothetical protein